MTIRIEPYKIFSGGGRALARRAGILRTTKKQINKHRKFDIIINWGNPRMRFPGARYINDPRKVASAGNKLETCSALSEAGIPTPEWTQDLQKATDWFEEGNLVLSRTLLRASGGRGILLNVPRVDESVRKAPLYTLYVKKAEEYRVHIFNGEIIDIQQKKKRQEVPNEEVDYQIRNHDKGWVFCRGGVIAPNCVRLAALGACDALGLDFGAVDIGYNKHKESACVYEINTAPGIEGTTVENYYTALLRALPKLKGGAYARRRRLAGIE